MYDYLFDDRDPVAEPGTADGTPGDWWTVMALSPEIMEHAVGGFLLYQSPRRALSPTLRELAQCRTGFDAGSQFVFAQHCRALRTLGVDEERIAAVMVGSRAACFDATERLVLDYVDGLALRHGQVADELMDELRQALGDEAVLELTYIAVMYLQHAVVSRALRTELDHEEIPLLRVPDPEEG
jgi:alkylhydroperoxidase family enzyme